MTDREQTMRDLEQQAAQAIKDGDLTRAAELREQWQDVRTAGNPTSPAAAVETRPRHESSSPSAVPMPGAGLEEVVENGR